MAKLLNIKAKLISDYPASLDRLESALARAETAITAREAELARLRRIEAAATQSLAELDALIVATPASVPGAG